MVTLDVRNARLILVLVSNFKDSYAYILSFKNGQLIVQLHIQHRNSNVFSIRATLHLKTEILLSHYT